MKELTYGQARVNKALSNFPFTSTVRVERLSPDDTTETMFGKIADAIQQLDVEVTRFVESANIATNQFNELKQDIASFRRILGMNNAYPTIR